jgi:hypothetical protein
MTSSHNIVVHPILPFRNPGDGGTTSLPGRAIKGSPPAVDRQSSLNPGPRRIATSRITIKSGECQRFG